MANQKPTKKTAPEKGQTKAEADLSTLMEPTDEDMELLEMTERTIVRDTPDDEETIPLNDLAEGGGDNIDTEALAKALDDAEAALDLSEGPDQDESISEKPAGAAKAKPAAKAAQPRKSEPKPKPPAKAAPKKTTVEADEELMVIEESPAFSEDEDETPAAETPKKGKSTGKKAPVEKEKGAGGKTSKSILLLLILVPVVAAVAMTAAFFLLRQPGGSGSVSPRPVARTADQGQPTAPAAIPVQSTRPQPADAPRPVQGTTAGPRPVVVNPPVIYTEAPGQPTGQAKPMPTAPVPVVQQPAQAAPPRVTTPQVTMPQVTTPPIINEVARSTPPVDKNRINTLQGINFKTTAAGLQMEILTDNPSAEYECFPLANPNRLVIDLKGKWNQPPFREKKLATGLISRIRLGAHEDKLRIVADVKSNQPLTPVFSTAPQGIVMSIANP